MFELEEIVWVYESPCYPRKAKIIRKELSGIKDYYQVEHLDGRDKIRGYIGYDIFKCPDEKNKLIDRLLDDGYDLLRYAKELQQEADNETL